jgi:hypothetical protein
MASREWTDDGANFDRARFNAEFHRQVKADPAFAIEMLSEASAAQAGGIDCSAVATLLSSKSSSERLSVILALRKIGQCRSYHFNEDKE